MKGTSLRHVAKLLLWGTLILTAVSANAQTTANGPYYATPSWDQTLPVTTRFIILANMGSNAVLDRETGIVWERSPSTSVFTLNNGNRQCQHLQTGGCMGWRLPQTDELFSLLDPAQINSGSLAALPPGHPFLNANGNTAFWVKDRAAPPFNHNAQILGVFLPSAFINNFDASVVTGATMGVWCVRGTGGAPIL